MSGAGNTTMDASIETPGGVRQHDCPASPRASPQVEHVSGGHTQQPAAAGDDHIHIVSAAAAQDTGLAQPQAAPTSMQEEQIRDVDDREDGDHVASFAAADAAPTHTPMHAQEERKQGIAHAIDSKQSDQAGQRDEAAHVVSTTAVVREERLGAGPPREPTEAELREAEGFFAPWVRRKPVFTGIALDPATVPQEEAHRYQLPVSTPCLDVTATGTLDVDTVSALLTAVEEFARLHETKVPHGVRQFVTPNAARVLSASYAATVGDLRVLMEPMPTPAMLVDQLYAYRDARGLSLSDMLSMMPAFSPIRASGRDSGVIDVKTEIATTILTTTKLIGCMRPVPRHKSVIARDAIVTQLLAGWPDPLGQQVRSALRLHESPVKSLQDMFAAAMHCVEDMYEMDPRSAKTVFEARTMANDGLHLGCLGSQLTLPEDSAEAAQPAARNTIVEPPPQRSLDPLAQQLSERVESRPHVRLSSSEQQRDRPDLLASHSTASAPAGAGRIDSSDELLRAKYNTHSSAPAGRPAAPVDASAPTHGGTAPVRPTVEPSKTSCDSVEPRAGGTRAATGPAASVATSIRDDPRAASAGTKRAREDALSKSLLQLDVSLSRDPEGTLPPAGTKRARDATSARAESLRCQNCDDDGHSPKECTAPCKWFAAGRCRKGDACLFSHDTRAASLRRVVRSTTEGVPPKASSAAARHSLEKTSCDPKHSDRPGALAQECCSNCNSTAHTLGQCKAPCKRYLNAGHCKFGDACLHPHVRGRVTPRRDASARPACDDAALRPAEDPHGKSGPERKTKPAVGGKASTTRVRTRKGCMNCKAADHNITGCNAPCKWFLRGMCTRGDACLVSHATSGRPDGHARADGGAAPTEGNLGAHENANDASGSAAASKQLHALMLALAQPNTGEALSQSA